MLLREKYEALETQVLDTMPRFGAVTVRSIVERVPDVVTIQRGLVIMRDLISAGRVVRVGPNLFKKVWR